jgi:hypothetical protein
MNGINWRAPERDAAYLEMHAACKGRGFLLYSALRYREALAHEGDYWLIDMGTGAQMFEADRLPDIRSWLRIPAQAPAHPHPQKATT